MDWLQALAVGGTCAGGLAGMLALLHSRNVAAKEQDRVEHEKRAKTFSERFDWVDNRIAKMSVDLGALTVQMAATITDVERRFLPRSEHAETITRLDNNIVELNRNLNALNSHLIDLARGRGGP